MVCHLNPRSHEAASLSPSLSLAFSCPQVVRYFCHLSFLQEFGLHGWQTHSVNILTLCKGGERRAGVQQQRSISTLQCNKLICHVLFSTQE